MDRPLSEALKETRQVFRSLVWPLWRDRLGGFELVSVEGSEQPLEQRVDFGGVDAFFAKQDRGILIPLASRIEFARSPDLQTARNLPPRFTIRSKRLRNGGWTEQAELQRLMQAYRDPVAKRYMPFKTFQSLVSREAKRVLFTSAVCTLELCGFIEQQLATHETDSHITRAGDAEFLRIPVSELRRAGVGVETLRPL